MFKMRLLLFIGWSNSGKSTLIRGLSGCPTKGFHDFVYDSSRDRCLYVIASSPQESGISESEYRRSIQTAYRNEKCKAVLLAIQPTEPTVHLSLENCIRIACARRHFEITAFVISHPHNENEYVPTQEDIAYIHERLSNTGVFNIVEIDNRLLLGENVARCLGVLL